MPNQVTQVAGSGVHVANIPSANLAALTFAEVGELQELGEFGREYNLINYSSLKERGTDKFKGTYNDGSFSVPVGRDDDDPGQAVLIAANEADTKQFFRIEFADGSSDYFEALVTSFRSQGGGLDAVLFKQLTLELTSSPIPEVLEFSPASTPITLGGNGNDMYASLQMTEAAEAIESAVLIGYDASGFTLTMTQSDDTPSNARPERTMMAVGTTAIDGSNNDLDDTRGNIIPSVGFPRPTAGNPLVVQRELRERNSAGLIRFNGQNVYLNIDFGNRPGNAAKVTPSGVIKLLYIPIGG